MKKILSILVASLFLFSTASAMTLSQFVERYNEYKGKGSPVSIHEQFVSENTIFLSRYEERDMVIAIFNPESSDQLENRTIKSIALKHKPRCAPSVFLTNIAAAVAAVYPDIPEEERMAEIFRTLRQSEFFFGNSYWMESPVPYNTEHMGQFVYYEEINYYTFLFTFPEDQP